MFEGRDIWKLEAGPGGTAVFRDAAGVVRCIADPRNVLEDGLGGAPAGGASVSPISPVAPAMGAPRRVLWSGWLSGQRVGRVLDDDRCSPAFEPDFATWTGRGRAALLELLAEPGEAVVFWPHHRHVLSDAQSCISLLRSAIVDPASWKAMSGAAAPRPPHAPAGHAPAAMPPTARPLGLILEPAALLTASMLPTAQDHLTRVLEALAGLPEVAAVVASGVRAASGLAGAEGPGPDEPELVCCPFEQGELPAGLVQRLIAELVPLGVPIVVR